MTKEWPDVMVGIPAYNRPATVCITVKRLLENLKYDGVIHIMVSEDGNCTKTYDAVSTISIMGCKVIKGPGKGLGANLNNLLKLARLSDIKFILNMDDDHWLEKTLDLTPHVKHLMEDETAGWIRFYGVGHHNYVADLKGRYWYVRWNSPTLYIPSFRPHLKHIRFHDHFGKYPEGRKLGATEEGFCHQCKDKAKKEGGPHVLVPLMYDLDWRHGVGTKSWQGKGH